jgi:hypothetical protein
MYIEFKLPSGVGGQAASMVNHLLNQELHNWADKYNIAYNTKVFKYTKRITFDDDTTYSFFAMTWNPTNKKFRSHFLNYRLVEPMDTRDK